MWLQKMLWDWCSLPNLEDKKIGLSSFEVFYKGASLKLSRNVDINGLSTEKKDHQEIIKV